MTTEQISLDFDARPTLVDQAARDTARTLIDAPVVVAAGAGAGKTEALIRRLETVLGGDEADPDRIVAITFTERAARDLVNKLRIKLPANLVPQIELMRVGTIHSFCLGILRRHPLEAGLPPVFTTQDELMSGADAADRIRRIRDAFFDRVAELDDPMLRQAIELYVSMYRLGMLHDLITLIDQQWDRFAEVSFELPDPWHTGCTAISDHIAAIAADPATPARLRELFAEASDGISKVAAAESMLTAIASIPAPKFGNNGGASWKETRDDVKARIETISAAVYECALGHVLHVLVPIVLAEAELRYRRGQLSFDDILVLTRRLLTDRPEIRSRLRAEIDHLCVDEFQDTDIVQYDIVRMLTDAPAPGGATHRPVLFAVGDPKQSIYGFREADVALFEELRGLPGLTQLELSTNFRSRPAILRWVNEVFAQWFAAGHGQVPFAPLAGHVPDAPAVVTVIGGRIDAAADEISRLQAVDIAATIAAASGAWTVRDHEGAERPARATDIAVLVRQRADLVHLEPALRRAGIPYVIEGGALLYDTREVRDLLRVLRAVNDTASPAKVVTALRTSVLAISDVELTEHRRAGGRWHLGSSGGGADRPGEPHVLGELARLRRWSRVRHHTPVPDLLQQIATESWAHAASLSDGAHTTTWRRLRLVLDEARWWHEQTGGSLGEYLAWIDVRVDNRDRTNVTSDETDEDAVHILTIHAAKGLEYPIVLVAGMGRQSGTGGNVRAAIDDPGTGRRALVKMGRFAHRDATARFRSDDEVASLEAARLAYVACTRAKDHLVVCLHHRGKSTAAEMTPFLGDVEPLELSTLGVVGRPPVAELSDRHDRPPARGADWRMRSSWSPTQLRHADGEPGPAVGPADPPDPEMPPIPVETVDTVEPTDAPAAAGEVVDSVHSKPPRPFGALPDQIGRYGTRVGRAVHGVLQLVDLEAPGRGLDALVAEQSAAEDVPDRLVDYVGRLVQSVLAGDVFARMAAASATTTVRREMYVGGEVDGEGVYGIIDAVWMHDGAFVLVDFKTDHALLPAEVLADRYRPQLQAYADALLAATGVRVGEALLCVARPDGSPALSIPVPVVVAV